MTTSFICAPTTILLTETWTPSRWRFAVVWIRIGFSKMLRQLKSSQKIRTVTTVVKHVIISLGTKWVSYRWQHYIEAIISLSIWCNLYIFSFKICWQEFNRSLYSLGQLWSIRHTVRSILESLATVIGLCLKHSDIKKVLLNNEISNYFHLKIHSH